MTNLEPQVREFWEEQPRLTISGAALSGAVSARQFVVDRGPYSHIRIQIPYSLNGSTSVASIVVSAESCSPVNRMLTLSGTSGPSDYAVETYQAVPTSGRITLRNLVQEYPTTSGASAVGAFWVPATPMQGRFVRITLGISGTSHGSDAVSALVGLCYG